MAADGRLGDLLALAREEGALVAVGIAAGDVVVDSRVRLKCQVPRCPSYGINLMCPPNAPSVEELVAALAGYREGILVQVAIDLPEPTPRSRGDDLDDVGAGRNYEAALVTSSRRLAKIVHRVEAKALALGSRFAAGFTAGSCRLCDECVSVQSGQPCRLAFRARPAMEAVGIDVVATASRAGLEIRFDDPSALRWTGLILID